MSQLEIGEKVIVHVDPAVNGGQFRASGIITEVRSVTADGTTGIVNLQLLHNGPGTQFIAGAAVYADDQAAAAGLAAGKCPLGEQLQTAYVAWWPAGTAERARALAAMAELVTNDLGDVAQDPAGDPVTV